MSEELLLKCNPQELLMILDQLYLNMMIDYRQRGFLDEQNKIDDLVSYKERQQIRYNILLRICGLLELEENKFEDLDLITEDLKKG